MARQKKRAGLAVYGLRHSDSRLGARLQTDGAGHVDAHLIGAIGLAARRRGAVLLTTGGAVIVNNKATAKAALLIYQPLSLIKQETNA